MTIITSLNVSTGEVSSRQMTPAELAAEAAINSPDTRLSAWRQTAYLDRAAFVRAVVRAGVLPAGEAVPAAKGDWPPTFDTALATLPVNPLDAQIDWAAAPGVARLNPLFLAVLAFYAAAENLTPDHAEALGDAIFGWSDANISNGEV